ncbi:uncharacterized protein LOC121240576 isoform X2 [Juglans microcarpa x Juglans regia]|uniref:uncharacterized protein LOC121240576 isoform X2 n=1 Tax=Juglans microcarpa x Juglans regia TaxID=2249226 RepID=UPI001B7E0CA4|nr:uncharacterized protein LOC121240576 isoform X2 [Juglans microcarpa x Juglans regia]
MSGPRKFHGPGKNPLTIMFPANLNLFLEVVFLVGLERKVLKIMEMEGKKQESSPSSITADRFGAKESPPSSSSGIFASIFRPPLTLVGRNSLGIEIMGSWQKQPSGNEAWNMKQGTPAISSGGACCSILNKDRSSIF